MKKLSGEITARSSTELEIGDKFYDLAVKFFEMQSRGSNWNAHALTLLNRQTLAKLLYTDNLYKKILNVPGVICEFGVHWGSTFSTLINLRGIYEPFNHSRRIFGFDTFSGFASIGAEDGKIADIGDYSTGEDYAQILEEICRLHEANAPISHIKKYSLIKGDASETVKTWLEDNPHAVISMAIFDMDLYKPTRDVLEAILPRLSKRSVLVFDELNDPTFPGETKAVQEVIGLNNLNLHQYPHHGFAAWAVFGE